MLERIEHGPIVELKLARPPVNAIHPQLIAELSRALRLAVEEGARALVLSGREGMFSAGLDLPLFLQLDREAVMAAWRDFFELLRELASSPIPIVAALTGHCPAGGCVLGLYADYRILAEGSYKIGLNEVAVGVRMPRPIHTAAVHVVGRRQAERMCTTAALLGTDEALRIGLVDEVLPGDRVLPRAKEWLEQLLQLPPETLKRTRAIARRDLVAPFRRLDEEQLELFMDEWFSEETQNAMRAAVERLKKKA